MISHTNYTKSPSTSGELNLFPVVTSTAGVVPCSNLTGTPLFPVFPTLFPASFPKISSGTGTPHISGIFGIESDDPVEKLQSGICLGFVVGRFSGAAYVQGIRG